MSVPKVAELLKASALPLLEARALLAHALASPREALVAHPEREVNRDAARKFEDLVARRRSGEPLAYLVGEREFYGRPFVVTAAVLIPRPETELLVQLALEHARGLASPKVLDLGTGSGCIAISLALELNSAEVLATDIRAAALAVARANAARLGARVHFIESDWYSAVVDRFDLIVANPPYVAEGDPHLSDLRYEPQSALVASDSGLACLRPIIAGAPAHLKPAGKLLVEHGYDQAAAVQEIFATAGFEAIKTDRDATGIERVTSGILRAGQASDSEAASRQARPLSPGERGRGRVP
ncbi:MAG TPA: peptide chain release factor N(5)-glutamine methyltransferase [Burkholderiaceae bacterium]|nr:peptide chain release factor N(5)-glutamine methyltransferase [Burkholderiaceae bacterium]